MRLVGGDRCSCGSVWAPWAAGRAFWGPVAARRASLRTGGRQPLGGCWIFQDVEVPYFHGTSWGCSADHTSPSPCFRICVSVVQLSDGCYDLCSLWLQGRKNLSVSQSFFSIFSLLPAFFAHVT